MFKTSESTSNIYPALIKAQANMPKLYKDSKAHHGKYAGIEDIIHAAYPWLTYYKLAVVVGPTWHEGLLFVTCRIVHESNEFIEGMMPVLAIPLEKENIQALGARITYVSRYLLRSILGFHNAEFDDDGDYETLPAKKPDLITKEQLDQLNYELAEYPEIKLKVIKALNIPDLAHMPQHKFLVSLERIREIKRDMSN